MSGPVYCSNVFCRAQSQVGGNVRDESLHSVVFRYLSGGIAAMGSSLRGEANRISDSSYILFCGCLLGPQTQPSSLRVEAFGVVHFRKE